MRNLVRGCVVVLAVLATCPAVSEAQLLGRRGRDCCCHTCQLPVAQCSCAAVVPQTTYQPVVETQYAQQPVLTQRDVVETQYRSEPVTETVPATAYDNVAVDEGSYQQVWVPRIVTKQVARTVYQQRTTYRTVPYQVTRRVAECTTQTVPYQTVRYVPTTTNALVYSGTTAGVAVAPYSSTIAANTYPFGTQWSAMPQVSAAPVYSPSPVAAAPASIGSSAPRTSSNSLGPVPDPRFGQRAAGTTAIQPRTASYDEPLGGYKVVPEPQPDVRQADNHPMFVPAPSAASVWRTPRGTVMR